jgi:hypothetical protein
VPPGFARFASLIEVVGQGDEERVAGRQRARFYKDRGYDITYVDLSADKADGRRQRSDPSCRLPDQRRCRPPAGAGDRREGSRRLRRRRSFMASTNASRLETAAGKTNAARPRQPREDEDLPVLTEVVSPAEALPEAKAADIVTGLRPLLAADLADVVDRQLRNEIAGTDRSRSAAVPRSNCSAASRPRSKPPCTTFSTQRGQAAAAAGRSRRQPSKARQTQA